MSLRLNPQFRWFVRQVKPFLRAHLLSVSMIVLSSLMFLLDPLLIKWLIDKVLPKRDVRLLLLAAGGFLSCRKETCVCSCLRREGFWESISVG